MTAGDYETIDSDPVDDTDDNDGDGDDDDDDDGSDSSGRDKDDDGGDDGDDHTHSDAADNGNDADDSNDAQFNAAHQALRSCFKTAEGITVTIVNGSIAAQKVCMSQHALAGNEVDKIMFACHLVDSLTLQVVQLVLLLSALENSASTVLTEITTLC